MKVRLTIEYDGTAYAGWQIQPNGPTIQAELERAAARVLGRPVRISAAGRTDAGVHALGQVACLEVERTGLEVEELRRALDALTPDDIVVRQAEVASDDFDPRRSARRRTYVYQIWNAPTPQVLLRRYSWHVRPRLDLEAVRTAAASLLGEHDFSSFQAAGCDAAHAVRRVDRSDVEGRGELLVYTISATAFLRHMVRNIVGTLVEVGLGRRAAADVPALLAARDRTLAGRTAPAQGLILLSVDY